MLRSIIIGYPPYIAKKNLLRRTETFTREKLNDLQSSLLNKILHHAVRNIPFYQRNISQPKICDHKDPFTFLSSFPIIDKNAIRNELENFLTGPAYRRLKVYTGGSTGNPMAFYLDRLVTRQVEKAFIFDQWGRVGYRFGDAIFNLRGRTPKKGHFVDHDMLFNIYYASSLDLSMTTVNDYITAINRIMPRFLHGYPSTMYQLAVLMENAGRKLQIKPTAVFCGSEKLFPYQKAKIEEIFGCRVYHWYGHSECLALGGACECSDVLHFYPQYGYTELLPTGVTDESGRELFEIIATGFNNRVMPLIRYRTGDYAVLSESQSCRCGRNYLLIDEVIGRQQEFIVDAHGSLISATSFFFGPHYKAFNGIESIKVHQHKPGAIEIVIVKGEGFHEELVHLMKNRMKDLMGDRMAIKIIYADTIEKSPIGKAKIVEQELDIRDYLPCAFMDEGGSPTCCN